MSRGVGAGVEVQRSRGAGANAGAGAQVYRCIGAKVQVQTRCR